MRHTYIFQLATVMIIIATGIISGGGTGTGENWELDCDGIRCRGVDWDTVQTVEVPFWYPDSLTHPPCTVKVFVQKRICGDYVDMKIVGYESNGCLPENSAGSTVYDVLGKIWSKNNYFGILPNSPSEGIKKVRIFRSPCWAEIEYIDNTNTHHKRFVPCEKACCIAELAVWKTDNSCYDGVRFYEHNTGTRMNNTPWCSASERDSSTGQFYRKNFINNIIKKDLGWVKKIDEDTYTNIKIKMPDSISILDTFKLSILQGCQYNCQEIDEQTIMRNGQLYSK